jgi:hypothetical protein
MATLSVTCVTLADWAKRQDPDGKIAKIIEMMSQKNEILQDIPYLEGNLPTGHRTTVRTGLPTVAWRLINQGVAPSKSTTAQIDEACGMLEAWCEVDVELAKLNGNVGAFRLSEASAFLEAMGQEKASTLFYGNSSTAPEEFTGLSARYSSLSATNGQNILSAGASGSDNSSVWLIVWGEQTLHGIYPKGSQAGLQHKDLGEQVVETSAAMGGNRMLAFRDQFTWKCGIALRDWRFAARICNIDISALVANSSGADLINLMIKAMHRIPSLTVGKAAFYMNRSVMQMLDIQKRDAVMSGGQLSYDHVDGKPAMKFRGVPVRVCDALHELETVVS